MFGPSLAQVIGATTLLSAADRLPPRAAMTISCLAFSLGNGGLALPGLPLWADFAIVMTLGLVASLRGGVSYGLLNEILPAGRLPAGPLRAEHVCGRHADLRVRASAACWWRPCHRAAPCWPARPCIWPRRWWPGSA